MNTHAAPKFIGLDTQYPVADGQVLTRIHLDGAASPLPAETALKTIEKLLPHYSNTHSYVHSSARITTQALAWAHDTILECLGANIADYTAIFSGSGTTAAINRVARGLAVARPDKKVVLISAMEHHANDLPHRQFDNQVEYIPLLGEGPEQGSLDFVALETLLKRYAGQVNYVTVSAVSNVTGIICELRRVAELVHQYDALLLVDGAQSVAHLQTQLSQSQVHTEIDFFVFSGHKVYTPASPGVLIAKKSILQQLGGQDLGGGSVESVSYYDYQLLSNYPDREQSGTPNIVGAIALAAVMQELHQFGYPQIEQHAFALHKKLRNALSDLPAITVYGDPQARQIAALSFNHQSIDHGLLAAILNDYYAIAVRNECFCAHPYVSSMIKEELWQLDLAQIPEAEQQAYINRKRGMVRVSLSFYNTLEDIERLISALLDIEKRIEQLKPEYEAAEDGSYQHKSFALDWHEQLNL